MKLDLHKRYKIWKRKKNIKKMKEQIQILDIKLKFKTE